jgi:dihydroneopterin aldolase
MYTIHLNNLVLTGKHGIYQQEHLLEAPFLLNISCIVGNLEIRNVGDAVDYEKVFHLVKEIFKTPYELLESLTKDIAVKIKSVYPQVEKVRVSVFKTNPAMDGLQGTVGVSFEG